VNLASRNDAKVVSLEVAPSTYYLQEVKGLFEHTNHFFQPGMETFSVQDANSISRLQVLNGLADAYTVRLDDVYGDLLTQFLSSHDNWPDSPCVHAQTEDGGQPWKHTLDVNNGTWRIAYNNPCERKVSGDQILNGVKSAPVPFALVAFGSLLLRCSGAEPRTLGVSFCNDKILLLKYTRFTA